jgi:hypothetical protein
VQVNVDALDNLVWTGTVTNVALLPESGTSGSSAYPRDPERQCPAARGARRNVRPRNVPRRPLSVALHCDISVARRGHRGSQATHGSHRQMTRDNDTVHMRYTLFTNQAPALADVRRGNRLRGEPDRAVPASRAVAVQV